MTDARDRWQGRAAAVAVAAAVLVGGIASTRAEGVRDRDPRNWPPMDRMVMDRYELAGRVLTLRVFARPVDYFNCSYRGERGRQMAFTLLGGPLETLTGYMPRELGKLLVGVLRDDPWTPITVQVRYDPARLSALCPDQVDIVKWSLGWQYPPGSLTPGRPDTTLQPTKEELDALGQDGLWALLMRRKPRRGAEVTEIHAGDRISLTAGARLSRAYHCVFKGAERTHYALQLHDGRGDILHAYVPRTPAARKLLDFISLHRDVLVSVQGKLVKAAMSHYCGYQLEVTGWTLPRRGAARAPAVPVVPAGGDRTPARQPPGR